MAQLSRPYQIALAAVAALALVWAVALRGHSSGSPEPSSSSSSSQPASGSGNTGGSSAQNSSPGAPSKVYHGATPGLEGLTRDVAKAHGAVATSEKNAAGLQRSSAQASGEAAATGGTQARASRANSSHGTSQASSGRSHTGVAQQAQSSARASHRHAGGASRGASGGASGASPSASGRAPQQLAVEHEITRGKTVLLLFWVPRSTVDNAVRSQVLALGRSSKGRLAVHVALADQVGLFGPVTEVAHVYQTPTILIVNKHGVVTTLTGLVDKFSLQQAVREAQQANR